MSQPIAVMRRLWQVMTDIFGHRWTSTYGVDAGQSAGQTWAKGLALLTPTQIGAGCDNVIAATLSWPPTLSEFRAMCFGIPSFEAVQEELRARNERRSPFVTMVWSRMDTHRYRLADAERGDKLLRAAYDLTSEHVMRGGALPEQHAELAAPEEIPHTSASEFTAKKHIAEIERVLNRREPIAEQQQDAAMERAA